MFITINIIIITIFISVITFISFISIISISGSSPWSSSTLCSPAFFVCTFGKNHRTICVWHFFTQILKPQFGGRWNIETRLVPISMQNCDFVLKNCAMQSNSFWWHLLKQKKPHSCTDVYSLPQVSPVIVARNVAGVMNSCISWSQMTWWFLFFSFALSLTTYGNWFRWTGGTSKRLILENHKEGKRQTTIQFSVFFFMALFVRAPAIIVRGAPIFAMPAQDRRLLSYFDDGGLGVGTFQDRIGDYQQEFWLGCWVLTDSFGRYHCIKIQNLQFSWT